MLNRWKYAGLLGAFLLFGVGFGTTAWAGPWSKDPGHFYVKLDQRFTWSSEANDPYFASITALYGEVGLVYGLQMQAFLPFTVSSLGKPNDPQQFFQVGSFTDAIIGLQWTPPFLMKRTGFPIAVRLDFKIPLYDRFTAKTKGLETTFSRFPLLGEGQVDITPWVSVGGGIPKTPLYAFGEVGFRIRTRATPGPGFQELNLTFLHTLVFQGQLGWFAHKRLLIMLNLIGAIPLGTGLKPTSPGFGSLPAGLRLDGTDEFLTKGFLGLGLGLYFKVFKGLAIEASFDTLPLTINANFTASFSFGVSYSY